MKRRNLGFTLMELMFTVALAAAVMAIGVPSFREFHRNNRTVVAANDALGGVIVSRSEALRRQSTVSMCTTVNPTSATATCGAGTGWIVFADTNENCTREAGEEIVSNVRVDDDVNAVTNGDCVSFASTGFRRVVGGQPTTQHMLYCDSRKNTPRIGGSDNSAARGVEVLPTGRGTVITSIAQIDLWSSGDFALECP